MPDVILMTSATANAVRGLYGGTPAVGLMPVMLSAGGPADAYLPVDVTSATQFAAVSSVLDGLQVVDFSTVKAFLPNPGP